MFLWVCFPQVSLSFLWKTQTSPARHHLLHHYCCMYTRVWPAAPSPEFNVIGLVGTLVGIKSRSSPVVPALPSLHDVRSTGGCLGVCVVCHSAVSQRRRRCYRQPINLYTATYEMMMSVRLLCLVFRARGRLSSDVSSAACVASRRRTVKNVYKYGSAACCFELLCFLSHTYCTAVQCSFSIYSSSLTFAGVPRHVMRVQRRWCPPAQQIRDGLDMTASRASKLSECRG